MGTELGGLLRAHRAAARLSREALAERAELSVEAIRALENGRRRYPRPSTIDQLVGALQLSESEHERLAKSARRPVVANAPRQLPPDLSDFVGREKLVTELAGLLTNGPGSGRGPTLVAIAGMGGIGKTSLAVRAARQSSAAFPDGQLYVDLRGHGGDPVAPLEALGRIMGALGVPAGNVPDELAAAAARYRSALAGRRMLLMLDNAASSSQVEPLLPGTAETVTLVTSRRRLSELGGATHITVDLLSEDEGVELLASVAENRTEQEPAAALEVVRLCGQLPLALRIAGTYLADRPALSLTRLAAELTDERAKLGVLSSSDAEVGVRSSLGVSIEALAAGARKVERAAARALPLVSLLPGEDFSLRVAAAAIDLPMFEAEAALEHLVDVNLLETPALRRYRIHDLIRAVGQDLALSQTSEADREALRLRVLDQYVAMLWRVDELQPQSPLRTKWHDPAWSAGAQDLPDLGSALEAVESDRAGLVEMAETATRGSSAERQRVVRMGPGASLYCRSYRRWPEWREINALALGSVDEEADPLGAFLIHFDLGLARSELDDFTGGAEHLATARRLAAELGDADYEAKSQMNLAHILEQSGRLTEAHAAAAESLAQALRLGNEDLETYSRLVLGQVAGKEGDLETQQEAFGATIDIVLREDKPSQLAALLVTIATSYRTTGQYDDALDSLRRAETLYRQVDSIAGVAEALEGVGAVWFELGRYQEALQTQREALEFALQGQMADREASIRVLLGQTLAALGRRAEAQEEWQTALRFYDGHGSPRSDSIRTLLAS